jgi:hypothetical protein
MRRLFTRKLAFVAAIAVSTATATVAQEFKVSTCPTPIQVQLQGFWADAKYSDEWRASLSTNPVRKATVAAAFIRPSLGSFTIAGLAAFEDAQGKVGQADFTELKSEFERLLSKPGNSTQSKMQERAGAVIKGDGSTLNHVSTSLPVSLSADRFYMTHNASMTSANGITAQVFNVQIWQLIRGCVIVASVTLPTPQYRAEDIDQAVANLVLK